MTLVVPDAEVDAGEVPLQDVLLAGAVLALRTLVRLHLLVHGAHVPPKVGRPERLRR